VCESRAEQGRYGGEHRGVYRRFHVKDAGVVACKACGAVVQGRLDALKRHLERLCGGIKVTWPVVDVDEHFAAVTGGGGHHRCAHCDKVVAHKGDRKVHMAACKSLPQDVREVLDHAAAAWQGQAWPCV